jgi:hypothetical protein
MKLWNCNSQRLRVANLKFQSSSFKFEFQVSKFTSVLEPCKKFGKPRNLLRIVFRQSQIQNWKFCLQYWIWYHLIMSYTCPMSFKCPKVHWKSTEVHFGSKNKMNRDSTALSDPRMNNSVSLITDLLNCGKDCTKTVLGWDSFVIIGDTVYR